MYFKVLAANYFDYLNILYIFIITPINVNHFLKTKFGGHLYLSNGTKSCLEADTDSCLHFNGYILELKPWHLSIVNKLKKLPVWSTIYWFDCFESQAGSIGEILDVYLFISMNKFVCGSMQPYKLKISISHSNTCYYVFSTLNNSLSLWSYLNLRCRWRCFYNAKYTKSLQKVTPHIIMQRNKELINEPPSDPRLSLNLNSISGGLIQEKILLKIYLHCLPLWLEIYKLRHWNIFGISKDQGVCHYFNRK